MNIGKSVKTIASATLIVGGVDLFYPSINVFMHGDSVTKLWQFVASGVFGQTAYSMGMAGVLYGILFHFLIMAIFSTVIYFLYKEISFIKNRPVLSGLLYGVCIWFVMNFL